MSSLNQYSPNIYADMTAAAKGMNPFAKPSWMRKPSKRYPYNSTTKAQRKAKALVRQNAALTPDAGRAIL